MRTQESESRITHIMTSFSRYSLSQTLGTLNLSDPSVLSLQTVGPARLPVTSPLGGLAAYALMRSNAADCRLTAARMVALSAPISAASSQKLPVLLTRPVGKLVTLAAPEIQRPAGTHSFAPSARWFAYRRVSGQMDHHRARGAANTKSGVVR